MIDTAYKKFCCLQKQLETDPEYLALEDERRVREHSFLAAIGDLREEQRAAILDYLGVCGELAQRMLEIACFTP